jgi:phospholipase C
MLKNFRVFQQAEKGSVTLCQGNAGGARGTVRVRRDARQAARCLLDYPNQLSIRTPGLHAADGAAFVASKIDAIAANPDVWAKTVFILNYDENDGLFDHVAPPVPPEGTPQEFVDGLPIGGGFRVPCIIVSPWTAGGWVCSQRFDHTSVPRFLEIFTGVREPNISRVAQKYVRRSDVGLPLRGSRNEASNSARYQRSSELSQIWRRQSA